MNQMVHLELNPDSATYRRPRAVGLPGPWFFFSTCKIETTLISPYGFLVKLLSSSQAHSKPSVAAGDINMIIIVIVSSSSSI